MRRKQPRLSLPDPPGAHKLSAMTDVANRFFDPNTHEVNSALNRQRMAYHEAGHAVAAWVKGLKLGDTHIGGRDGHFEYVETDAELVARFGPADAIDVRVVVRLAGGCAQRRKDPQFIGFGCDEDNRGVDVLTRELAGSCRAQLLNATEALVENHWHRVEALAVALLDRGTVGGTEATKIIKFAPKALAQGPSLGTP
jgi:hypothetical protein